jgi:hypothetical protein
MGKYDDQMGEPISHTAAAKILERIQAQQKRALQQRLNSAMATRSWTRLPSRG